MRSMRRMMMKCSQDIKMLMANEGIESMAVERVGAGDEGSDCVIG